MKRIALFALLAAVGLPVQAKTLYVTDVLYLTLRAGNGDQFEVTKTIKSGARLELLEEGEDYHRVRTEKGEEGWVRNSYLVEEPIAAHKLAQAEQRLERVTRENEQLKERVQSLRRDMSKTEEERKRLATANQKLSTENARIEKVAAEPLEIKQQNDQLLAQNETMKKELATLRQENEAFKEQSAHDWFLTGAGVLVGGMLIGLVVPKLRMRRGSDWI